jgi:spore maturation protein CgeB
VFESTFLGFKLANIERVSTLNRLSKTLRGYNTALYTDTIDSKLEGIDYRGAVAYMTHMPLVFNNSRINLNMTIRNIRTGIPLRVWDILGAGGFLLTNFQVELPDYFENGKDIVYYEDINDQKAVVQEIIDDISPDISMHDFRTIKGPHITNLIFDVLVPFGFDITFAWFNIIKFSLHN